MYFINSRNHRKTTMICNLRSRITFKQTLRIYDSSLFKVNFIAMSRADRKILPRNMSRADTLIIPRYIPPDSRLVISKNIPHRVHISF